MLEYITPFHLSLARRTLTQEYINDYKLYEDQKFDAYCANCLKPLQIGDWIDGKWPYHNENNVCLECMKDEFICV